MRPVLYTLLAQAADAPATDPSDSDDSMARSLEEMVLARLREYATNLQGHEAKDMYDLIMPQLERPLVRVAMELARGRQRQAAEMLGIHRNTLRTRLKELGLDASGRARARKPARRAEPNGAPR
jgi:two-component system nitrogen regulation response regulator GlnG